MSALEQLIRANEGEPIIPLPPLQIGEDFILVGTQLPESLTERSHVEHFLYEIAHAQGWELTCAKSDQHRIRMRCQCGQPYVSSRS